MYPGYGDVRYMVYIWGFSCWDYSFDALISWICNLSLYNRFCYIHFTWCLIFSSCVPVLMTLFSIYAFDSDLSIHVCLSMHATWHLSYHSLGSFLTPLDLHVQILDVGPWWTSYYQSGVAVAYWISDRLSGVLFLLKLMSTFCMFILVYLLVFSFFRLSVM